MDRSEFSAMFGTKSIHNQAREQLKKCTVAEIVELSDAALERIPQQYVRKMDRTKLRLTWAFSELLYRLDPTRGRGAA